MSMLLGVSQQLVEMHCRFTFYAPKTSVWVSHVPLPGHENQDFEDLKKFHKYGIVM